MGSIGAGKEIARYPLGADITNSATSLTVGTLIAGTAIDDDTPEFYAVLEDGTSNYEAVKVVGVSGTTWTIIRAQKSTSGVAHSKDATIQVIDTDVEAQLRVGAGNDFALTIQIAGAISTGQQAIGQAVLPCDARLIAWSLFLNTANAGSTFISDLEKNGTDVGPVLTVADGATTSTRVVATADIDFVRGDRVRLDVDQVGSGTAGSNLVATLEFERI